MGPYQNFNPSACSLSTFFPMPSLVRIAVFATGLVVCGFAVGCERARCLLAIGLVWSSVASSAHANTLNQLVPCAPGGGGRRVFFEQKPGGYANRARIVGECTTTRFWSAEAVGSLRHLINSGPMMFSRIAEPVGRRRWSLNNQMQNFHVAHRNGGTATVHVGKNNKSNEFHPRLTTLLDRSRRPRSQGIQAGPYVVQPTLNVRGPEKSCSPEPPFAVATLRPQFLSHAISRLFTLFTLAARTQRGCRA